MGEQPEDYDMTFFGEFRKNLGIPFYRAGVLALLGAEITFAPEAWRKQCFELAGSSALEIEDINWRAYSLVGTVELLIDGGDIQGAHRILEAVALLGTHYAEVQILARIGIATGNKDYIRMSEIAMDKIHDPDLRNKALMGIEKTKERMKK